jgi:pimeloyl-ACP methyl ester carboxylesterase
VDGPTRSAEAVDPTVRAFVGRMQREAFELPEWDPEHAPEHELSPPAAVRLSELGCPVLVIAGDADDPAILEVANRIANEAPRARLVIVPGAGHMLSLEQPAPFADLLARFLSDVASGRFDGQPVVVPASSGPEQAELSSAAGGGPDRRGE